MPAVTIRHDGLIFSGQTLRGTGRPGSVGIRVMPGLDLVVIHACSIRGFDVAIAAESPVVVVNCEILDYLTAGIAATGGAHVEFCSFLDLGKSSPGGAILISATSATVRSCLFQIEGAKRWFGIGDPRRPSWDSEDNIGLAGSVFGRSGRLLDVDDPRLFAAGAAEAVLNGVEEAPPYYGDVRPGLENLRLLPHSAAIRRVSSSGLPEIGSRWFDAATHLPVTDRGGSRRPVESLTAGANEMGFSLTRPGAVRVLELVSGLSDKPFAFAASGRDGVFLRLPHTASNPSGSVVEDPLDIQPSPDLAVITHRGQRTGSAAMLFKPERGLKVPFLAQAKPSGKSSLNGVSAVTAYAWVRPLSENADIVITKPGRGRAQYRPVFELAMRFGGQVAPNFSVKTSQPGGAGIDYTMVAESAALRSAITRWTAAGKYVFLAASWDRGIGTVYAGAEGDGFLQSFSARPFVLDELTEEMVGGSVAPGSVLLDPNDSPFIFGCDTERGRGWHGFIDDVAIDIGQALGRKDLEAVMAAEEGFPDVSRFLRDVPQTDLVVARRDDIFTKAPGAAAAEVSSLRGYFSEIRRVVSSGQETFVAAKRMGGVGWGVFRLDGGSAETILENISGLVDVQIDRRGHLVIAAVEPPLSRIDPAEGVRYSVTLPGALPQIPDAVGVGPDNEVYLSCGPSVFVILPPEEISSGDTADMDLMELSTAPASLVAIECGGDGAMYAVDPSPPRLLKIGSFRTFDIVVPLDIGTAIAAGGEVSVPGADFAALGVRPGDSVAFVSDEDGLTTPEGEVVAAASDPLEPGNSEVRHVRASGTGLTVEPPFVDEAPETGRRFELRAYRRETVDSVAASAGLVGPVSLAANPYDTENPVYVADPEALAFPFDPARGVAFLYSRSSGLGAALHLSTLGIDLSTISDLSVRDDAALPPRRITSSLKSRLSWHMEPSGRVVRNSAYPGASDIALPALTLSDLVVAEPASRTVVLKDGAAVAEWTSEFGPSPNLDAVALDDEFENLSELGIVTEDGVLLARTTLARMPYDSLSETSTRFRQAVRIVP